MRPVTGEQHHLVHAGPSGELRATVVQLAAAIRGLTLDGVDLVEPYGEDVVAPMGAGMVLVPWPNRIRGARYVLDGKAQALDVTEPSLGNASHGLLRNTGYTASDRADDRVTLSASVFPQHGYPFLLGTSVTYRLTDDGLVVTHRIRNDSAGAAPVAVGAHPYLAIGGVPSAELTLTVRADTWSEVDDALIPIADHPVDGADEDLRQGRVVGDLDLNTGYGDVHVEDGVSRHGLIAPDGRGVELWADASFRFLQVYTPREFPTHGSQAVALEPMTAPADAFNSGVGVRRLEPGEEWNLSWGIRATGAWPGA
ncbi:aldose 1-epimerase family protein [Clavibacter tessellarius]|uniref:Aldose epimerase n=1 Tax=Clavibacter tessellarius TaxID=31965 RepID=A0A154V1M9_9MICO|nr:aldose 1-epimerase family protein [Clavibacter michiganensis]KZC95217.1 aldose epimerase [Clavibacter michiganensis subsp. tessellarius]